VVRTFPSSGATGIIAPVMPRARKPAPSPVFSQVHALVAAIPRGRVATYGQLSQLIGGRLTPVGIGWALSGCGDAIPWHRVINAHGGISTKSPAAELQRDLLEAEGVAFRPDGTVNLPAHQWNRRVAAPKQRATQRRNRQKP
jgi:methylated-DNA-protein-cysteine methyltransferase-like protein